MRAWRLWRRRRGTDLMRWGTWHHWWWLVAVGAWLYPSGPDPRCPMCRGTGLAHWHDPRWDGVLLLPAGQARGIYFSCSCLGDEV